MVDARLKDGSRVNIVFPPLALDGPYVSIRKFGTKEIDFAKLIEWKALTLQVARVLEIAAEARLNVIISGGTGSGKTTLMNAMSRLIDPGERVVTVEDAAELQLQQPHVVRLETRPSSLEGKRRGHPARPGAQRAAHAPRPHHRRRGARRRGVRHAAGHEHRPRRQHVHHPRQHHARRADPHREHGADGQHGPAVQGHPHPDRRRRRSDRAGRTPARRRPPRDPGDRGLRHGRRRHHPERHLPVRGPGRRRRTASCSADYKVSRVPPSFPRRLSYFGLDKAWKAAMEEVDQ